MPYQSVFNTSTVVAPIKSTGYQSVFNDVATKPVSQIKTGYISPFLGGGAYNIDTGDPNKIVNTGHTDYANEPAQSGMQRDDIMSVGLGGQNTNPANIKSTPLPQAKDMDKLETQLAADVKAGKISLPMARGQLLEAKRQASGQEPAMGVLANLFPAIKEMFTPKQSNLTTEKAATTTTTQPQPSGLRTLSPTDLPAGQQPFAMNPPTEQQKKDILNPKQTFLKNIAENVAPSTTQAVQDIIKSIKEQPSNPTSTLDAVKKIGTDYVKSMYNSVDSAYKQVEDLFNPPKPRSASQTAGKILETTAGSVGAVISPITAIFSSADSLPILGSLSKIMTLPFAAIGDGGRIVFDTALNILPLNENIKNNIRNGWDAMGSLAAQLLVGGSLYGKGKEILANAKDGLVKQFGAKDAQTIMEQAIIKAQATEQIHQIEPQPLAQEAGKYKSAEEFVKAKIPETKFDKYLEPAVTDHYGNNLPENVKIYRSGDIKPNSFVATNEKTANSFVGDTGRKVTSMEVPRSDLMSVTKNSPFGGSQFELIYKPKSQLTDIWNKANQSKAVGEVKIPEAPATKSSINLTSGINPGLDKFIEQDIKPAASGLIGGVSKTIDFIRKTLAPATRGEEAIKTSSIMRESLGRMARNKELTYSTLQKSKTIFDGYTPEQSLDFMDKLEHGQPIAGAENFVKVMRDALDSRWKQIQDIKGSQAYIENYFPHIWKDPAKAGDALAQFFGKIPLEGTKGYMKQRVLPTIQDGIKLGLEPASYNPVDLIMSRVADMDRFLMANDVWTQFKDQGLRKFVPFGQKAPEGYQIVNDKIARSFQFSPEEKGMILRGNWYMPEKAATIINNYLSPGLRNNPIYDAFRMTGNTLNQVQLGLSGFHALFTSGDAVISKAALEIQKTTPTSLIKAALTPVTAPYYLFKNLIRGNKLLSDYFSKNPEMPAMVDALERAGGRVKTDSFYLNNSVDNFLKALRSGNPLGAFVRAPGALVEEIAKPIMQELVPRQKLGVFADGATHILEQAKNENWNEYKTTLRLQEMWDSVDNRMGQLVYDNLFWNKVLKDMGMAATRSLGWNLGTIRELGGGIKDFAKLPIQLLTKEGRSNIRMTPKMAYTLALPYVAGVWGAAVYYLYNGTAPQQPIDYYAPWTGQTKPDGTKERLLLPSYMKDVLAYSIEPGQTIKNKLHPEITAILDMLKNQDYYGTEIRNANDPIVKQIGDLFAYQAKQFVPFSITNLMQRTKINSSWMTYLQSFAGITPAPSYITRTPLQTEIYNLYDQRFGGGIKSQEQSAVAKQKAEIRTLYLTGKDDEANQKLEIAVKQGVIKANGVSQFIQEADIPNDIKLFKQLPSGDQENLIKKMELVQLQRYGWYVHQDIKDKFSTISANTKNFVDLYNQGEVKEPVWKRNQEVKQ